jgi:hypothetical protein
MYNNGGSASQAVKCIGFGRIFGHKFKMNAGDYTFVLRICKRCGYHPEGWEGIEKGIEK